MKDNAEFESKNKEFKQNEGIKLVDDLSEIKTKLFELKKQSDELKEKLVLYGKQFEMDTISGSNKIVKLKEFDKVVLPKEEDREEFIKLMKDKGIYDECSMLSYSKINLKVLNGEVDDEIKNKVEIVKDWRISLSKRNNI